MFEEKDLRRIVLIGHKIESIEVIMNQNGGSIVKALEDEDIYKPAILMHLTSIAEQFTKLQQNAAFKILEQFAKDDIRGTFAVRNFIAHDYDGVNLSIVEDVIRERLPQMKKICDDMVN